MTWSVQDFAEAAGVFRREMAGAVRRFVIGRSDGGVWQVLGHLLFDPTKRETKDVENYPGIGIFARPPNGSGEGIVVQAGGPNNPAIVATRDEATRAKVNDIDADESTLYNSLARVYVKKDGTVEIRTHAGVALALPTMADFLGIISIMASCGAGSATAVPVTLANYQAAHPTWPDGTKKLKGE